MAKKMDDVTKPSCTWTFRASVFDAKNNAEDTRGSYFRAYARCKRAGCDVTCCLKLNSLPAEGCDEVCVMMVASGTANHEGPPARRHLTGHDRKAAADQAIHEGAYNVRKDMLNAAKAMNLKDGNFTGVPNPKSIRKAAWEERMKNRFDSDVMRDLRTTQVVSQATDIVSEKLKGHIHMLSHDPFYVVIYNETTLKNTESVPKSFILMLPVRL